MRAQISLIGLPVNASEADISAEAQRLLSTSTTVYCHPTMLAAMTALVPGHEVEALAAVVDPVTGLLDGYAGLVETLCRNAPSVYVLPGDPQHDYAIWPVLQEAAQLAGLTVAVLQRAPSRMLAAFEHFALTPGTGLQVVEAAWLASQHYPALEPHRPALITSPGGSTLQTPLRHGLAKAYPAGTPVQALVNGEVRSATTSDWPPDAEALFIPASSAWVGLTAFQEVIAHLRAPNGCPWDRKQTHQSLRRYLLEETYEVLETLDRNDTTALADELGDLLLQIVLHSQVAVDSGTFVLNEVITHIHRKMLRRHPHVFADVSVQDAEEVTTNWAAIKAQEKAEKGLPVEESPSVLEGVQIALPALAQALEISRRAVKVGFEWAEIDGVLHKLVEEAEEIAAAEPGPETEAELGDFLFTAVNLARKLNVDAENALRAANARFTRRFKRVEVLAQAQGLVLTELEPPAWFALWQQAKQELAPHENGVQVSS